MWFITLLLTCLRTTSSTSLQSMIFTFFLQCYTCFITARKRSLGQGNVFTPLCHSVHRGDLCPSIHHRSHDQGGLCPGGSLPRGSLSRRGQSLSRGVSSRETPPSNEWAVRILLECILVVKNFNK